jgi:hypothetical protein
LRPWPQLFVHALNSDQPDRPPSIGHGSSAQSAQVVASHALVSMDDPVQSLLTAATHLRARVLVRCGPHVPLQADHSEYGVQTGFGVGGGVVAMTGNAPAGHVTPSSKQQAVVLVDRAPQY